MKKNMYIYNSGFLKRQDESLVLKTKDKNIYLPVEQIDTIICFSDISLNKRTLSLLKRYHISMLFYNFYGDFIGSFNPEIKTKGSYLIEQVDAYNDNKKRLSISKEFNESSFHNMMSVLKYYNKKVNGLNYKIKEVELYISLISKCESINQLLMLEARCKQTYYSCFDYILKNTDYEFISRSKYPPQNEINAMMSYGYSLLYGVVASALHQSKLSPEISFIHSNIKHNDSLKYDIADIFKPILVDRLIFRLCRKHLINKKHFEYKDKRTYLNKEGAKIFCEYFNKNLEMTVLYHNRNYSYRSIINREINSLSKYIKDDQKYIGYKMKW